MVEITRYVLVDTADIEQDAEYETLDDAMRANQYSDYAIIARSYVYDDSELVWTPDGSDTWPPAKGEGS